MGTIANEIRTETSMKGVEVLGFATMSRNCAEPNPM